MNKAIGSVAWKIVKEWRLDGHLWAVVRERTSSPGVNRFHICKTVDGKLRIQKTARTSRGAMYAYTTQLAPDYHANAQL